jgi:catechol 2,3-dioxygenase-like lactoylglutathione lyase family enzyme
MTLTGKLAGETWRLDHASLTVPDVDEAVAFFQKAAGATVRYSVTAPPGSAPDVMTANQLPPAEAGYRLVKLDIAGTPVELFEFTAPGLRSSPPRNCDAGGHHLAFHVHDLDAALATLRAIPGTRILGQPSTIQPPHALAGRRWIYFLTPWGQQLELVSDQQRTTADPS